jgi:hypothetical protein
MKMPNYWVLLSAAKWGSALIWLPSFALLIWRTLRGPSPGVLLVAVTILSFLVIVAVAREEMKNPNLPDDS